MSTQSKRIKQKKLLYTENHELVNFLKIESSSLSFLQTSKLFIETLISLIIFIDFIIVLKVIRAFLLRLFALLAFSSTLSLPVTGLRVMIVESHFLISSATFEDDLKVWNKVDAFVCFKESLENYDFWRLTCDNFLVENCKNCALLESLRSFVPLLRYGWLYLRNFLALKVGDYLYLWDEFFSVL